MSIICRRLSLAATSVVLLSACQGGASQDHRSPFMQRYASGRATCRDFAAASARDRWHAARALLPVFVGRIGPVPLASWLNDKTTPFEQAISERCRRDPARPLRDAAFSLRLSDFN